MAASVQTFEHVQIPHETHIPKITHWNGELLFPRQLSEYKIELQRHQLKHSLTPAQMFQLHSASPQLRVIL